MPGGVESDTMTLLLQTLMDKIFNQAAAEFCVQVASIWGAGGSKEGVGIKQELKVQQKKKADKIEKDNPVKFEPAQVLAMSPYDRHIHLAFIVKFHAGLLEKKATTIPMLKKFLRLYAPKVRPLRA